MPRWRSSEAGFLELEPKETLYGVVSVQGGTPLHPFQVRANSPPSNKYLTDRVPLFTRQTLDQDTLHFFVPGFGHFKRSLADLRLAGDWLYRAEAPSPGGSLLVHVVNQPDAGFILFAKPATNASGVISVTGERSGSMWRFESLAAGEYRFMASYSARRINQRIHSERLLPETATVQSLVETETTVQMPELIAIHGEIANWQDSRK